MNIKKIFNFSTIIPMVGIIVSIIIIILGISTSANATNSFAISRITFGGDFYTEIYE